MSRENGAREERIERILDRTYQMTDAGRVCTIRDLYTTFSPNVDLEALKATEFFPALEAMMEPVLDAPDERSPQGLAYWAKRGMVKEFHGADAPMDWDAYAARTGYRWQAEKFGVKQNEHKLWTSFVPVSAFAPRNKGRKYPLVFAFHGAQNNLFLVEGWGFVQEAARRGWIVIIPSLELDDIVEEILEEAKRLYPVDETRVYATGFSYGGWASNRLGNQRPELFAAVGPCGTPMDNAFQAGDTGDREPLPPFDGVPRALALGIRMPIINVYGQCDADRFPFYDFHGKKFGLASMETPADLLAGINCWARVNGAPEVRLEDVLALKGQDGISDAEREVGLPLAPDCRRTYTADGVRFHRADLKSADGVVRVRILAEMNIPHWPTPELARQVFAFFSHFSRDPATRASIYTP